MINISTKTCFRRTSSAATISSMVAIISGGPNTITVFVALSADMVSPAGVVPFVAEVRV